MLKHLWLSCFVFGKNLPQLKEKINLINKMCNGKAVFLDLRTKNGLSFDSFVDLYPDLNQMRQNYSYNLFNDAEKILQKVVNDHQLVEYLFTANFNLVPNIPHILVQ